MADRTAVGGSSRLDALRRLGCPVSARGADRETAICRAVVDLLNETTYESVTMDAVAARAKASKATIYRRWSNKNDLVVEALGRALRSGISVPTDTGSLRGDLAAEIRSRTMNRELLAANTAAVKTLLFATSSDVDLARKIQLALRSVQLPAWQTILDRCRHRGEIDRSVDAAMILDVAMAQFCSRISVQGEPVDPIFVDHVIDDVLVPVIRHAGLKSPV